MYPSSGMALSHILIYSVGTGERTLRRGCTRQSVWLFLADVWHIPYVAHGSEEPGAGSEDS